VRSAGQAAGGVLAATGAAGVLLLLCAAGAAAGNPPPPPTGCGPAGTGVTVAGVRLSAGQVGNAQVIARVAVQRGLPSTAAVIAVAAALQESGLVNLQAGDRDSLGLFQQRPSQGWGTPAQILNPAQAATRFYQALTALPGWAAIPLTAAAQAVQHSRYPDGYARWQPMAAAPRGVQLWVRYDRTTGVYRVQGSGKTLDLLAPALLAHPGAAMASDPRDTRDEQRGFGRVAPWPPSHHVWRTRS
jgi:hypothetical protein